MTLFGRFLSATWLFASCWISKNLEPIRIAPDNPPSSLITTSLVESSEDEIDCDENVEDSAPKADDNGSIYHPSDPSDDSSSDSTDDSETSGDGDPNLIWFVLFLLKQIIWKQIWSTNHNPRNLIWFDLIFFHKIKFDLNLIWQRK